MTRILLPLIALLGLLAPGAAEQLGFGNSKADARLYTRVEDGEIRAVIRVRIEPRWHLYHSELGHPKAVGKPTVVTLDGEGVEWSEVVFPKPHKSVQEGLGDGDADPWIWDHSGTILLYALGTFDGEAPETVTGEIKGQTCEEGGVCIQYSQRLKSRGEGKDELFAKFPSFDAAQDATADEKQQPAEQVDIELFVRQEGGEVRAAVVFDVREKWHIGSGDLGNPEAYGKPTLIEVRGEGVAWDDPVFPKARKYEDKWGSPWMYVHEGKVAALVSGAVTGEVDPASITARVSGQVCETGGVCILFAQTLTSAGTGPAAVFERDTGSTSKTVGTKGDTGLLPFLLLAVGGGLFALMMPCTYPMIPITISFFTKQADARGGNVLGLSLVYGAGIVAIFVLIGLLIGPAIIRFATDPVTNIVIGLLFAFFALVLFGVFTLNPPRFLMNAAGKASMQGGFFGVFLMGATLVVTSFTCTAPFVGSLLSVGATGGDGDLLRVALGMGVFGLTMAIPFVFLSLLPGKIQAIPQSGEWMNTLKVTLGFVELAAALKFFSNADLVWGWGMLSRELFLLLWTGIFGLTAFFLFGWLRFGGHGSGEIGAGRAVAGMAFVMMGLYCLHGYRGHAMDGVMTAIIPNYSSALGHAESAPGKGVAGLGVAKHTIVKDDFDAAKDRAAEEGKLLFVNFTGFT